VLGQVLEVYVGVQNVEISVFVLLARASRSCLFEWARAGCLRQRGFFIIYLKFAVLFISLFLMNYSFD